MDRQIYGQMSRYKDIDRERDSDDENTKKYDRERERERLKGGPQRERE